ncbi:hypothetical protein KIV56_10475 [Cryobacterium breve]|uniref:Uncharacterized protein n=1 Tax=Cryobacterium breve TaxID=1259258 RepID=A0ABY7N9K0_9MICO|nr:hypothetical protein [Cryobacterium breve]WBM78984.1 hypothetical protein KIV56_10475 [Cryobacterium breve]
MSAEPPVGPLASLPRITLDRLTFAESMLLATELLGPQADEALRRMLAFSSSGSPSELARNARLLTSRHLGNTAPVALPFRASRAPRPGPHRNRTTSICCWRCCPAPT